ncbi:MAG: 16S rRNA (cytosine(1402)-N(4))-methyltransferase RsmH [Nitrospinales bacterium]
MIHHKSVLSDEVLHYLDLKNRKLIVDGTTGEGGHTELILKHSDCRVLAIDRDGEILERAKKRLAPYRDRVTFIHGNYSKIKDILMKENISKIDGFLMDLGFSSFHVDTAERGFSFQKDGPLDLRLNRQEKTTAADVLATASDKELHYILKELGEERKYRRIVRAIRTAQAEGPIISSSQLTRLITSAVGSPRSAKIHSASRTYLGLRLFINDELGHLKEALKASLDVLDNAGRLLVISFHSLEDRIVKHFFKDQEKGCICPPKTPVCVCGKTPTLKILTRKPVIPSAREIAWNPRASSAKLRVAERICA